MRDDERAKAAVFVLLGPNNGSNELEQHSATAYLRVQFKEVRAEMQTMTQDLVDAALKILAGDVNHPMDPTDRRMLLMTVRAIKLAGL